ncbi:hypothetical protein MP228_004504 [Amoeboaphelidium protococcarum]|nr:hypothetical protein MP228_004504 [Amoeboaphelidium protococcarum]
MPDNTLLGKAPSVKNVPIKTQFGINDSSLNPVKNDQSISQGLESNYSSDYIEEPDASVLAGLEQQDPAFALPNRSDSFSDSNPYQPLMEDQQQISVDERLPAQNDCDNNAGKSESIVSQSSYVPVTFERPVANVDQKIMYPGKARFNTAPDKYHPEGTPKSPQNRSVLQQHVDFFDRNKDGIITPLETFAGFRALGYHWFWAVLAMFVIHSGFSPVCNNSWWPIDPFFRIWTEKIHKGKHGSDTGTYDNEGRFIPQKFEEIFSKWDVDRRNALNHWQLWQMASDLKCVNDFFGWFAARFEWFAVWLLCADENGYVTREQVRGIFDGSLFYRIEAERKRELEQRRRQYIDAFEQKISQASQKLHQIKNEGQQLAKKMKSNNNDDQLRQRPVPQYEVVQETYVRPL